MTDKPTSIDYLTELLQTRDAELEEARAENARLERELEGSLEGWSRKDTFDDDGALPVPRFELFYVQIEGWDSYRVDYRLVMKHLHGHLVAIPLGRTTINSSARNQRPNDTDLPIRDGAHAAHDSALMGLPVFKVLPGEAPILVDTSRWEFAKADGLAHRRETGGIIGR